MGNEGTKEQIRRFLEEAVEESKTPNVRETIKREREKRKTKVQKRFGL